MSDIPLPQNWLPSGEASQEVVKQLCWALNQILSHSQLIAMVAVGLMPLIILWATGRLGFKKTKKTSAEQSSKATDGEKTVPAQEAAPKTETIRKKETVPQTPFLLVSWMVLAFIYGVGRFIDFIAGLSSTGNGSAVERYFLEDTPLMPFLPLFDFPYMAVVIHCGLWTGLLILGYKLHRFVGQTQALTPSTKRHHVPVSFRITGCSTTYGLDVSVKNWLRPISTVFVIVVGLAFFSQPTQSGEGMVATICQNGQTGTTIGHILSPGLLVLLLLLSVLLTFHCRQKTPMPKTKPTKAPAPELPTVDPIKVLRKELSTLIGEDPFQEPLPSIKSRGPNKVDWPAELSPLLSDMALRSGLADKQLHFTQSRMLNLLRRDMSLPSVAEVSADLTSAPTVLAAAKDNTARSVVISGPQGVGRLTTLLLMATASHLERGGTTLFVTRDTKRLDQVYATFSSALQCSALRWSIETTRAKEGLRDAIAARKMPAIVFTDLASLETDLLLDKRCDDVLRAIDLVLIDELNEYVGIAEMHLALIFQRLWLALEHVERNAGLPLTVATMGPGFQEASAWASALLRRRTEIITFEGPASKSRIMLRREHLAGPDNLRISLTALARACENGGLHWHLRMSGDGMRSVERLDGELKSFSKYRVDNPTQAAVVLLEGSFGEVQRELEMTRLVATGTDYTQGIQVAAPPVEEEAVFAPMVHSLPWLAIPLDPPLEILRIHAMRASRARSYEADKFMERLFSSKHASNLQHFIQEGVLDKREQIELPPDAFQPKKTALVTRAASAPPLPAIHMHCATSQRAKLSESQVGTFLEWVDAAIAEGVYYPGAIRLLPEGRFQVAANPKRWRLQANQHDNYSATYLEATRRSIAERTWTVDEHALWKLNTTERSLGAGKVQCRFGEIHVRQRLDRVRIYGSQGELLEARQMAFRVESIFNTHIFLLETGLDTKELHRLRPVVAALAMTATTIFRTGRNLLQVGVFSIADKLHIGFVDRTPQGNGITTAIDEFALLTLLKTTQDVLQNLTDKESNRLRDVYDQTPDAEASQWDVPAACQWLASMLSLSQNAETTVLPPKAAYNDALAKRVCTIYRPFDWYPQEERALFLETVQGFLDSIPIKNRRGVPVTNTDRLSVAVGMAAVFYRRPDLKLPKGFYVAFEPGYECQCTPGASAYCTIGDTPHISIAVMALRESSSINNDTIIPHQAGHLFDTLDGTTDGLLGGMTAQEREHWQRIYGNEVNFASQEKQLLNPNATVSRQQFLAATIAAFIKTPLELKTTLPHIYSGLRSALRQDPAAWKAAASTNADSTNTETK